MRYFEVPMETLEFGGKIGTVIRPKIMTKGIGYMGYKKDMTRAICCVLDKSVELINATSKISNAVELTKEKLPVIIMGEYE